MNRLIVALTLLLALGGQPIRAAAPVWIFAGDSITDAFDLPERVCATAGCAPWLRNPTLAYRPAMSATTLEACLAPWPPGLDPHDLAEYYWERAGYGVAATLVIFVGTNDIRYATACGWTLATWRGNLDLIAADLAGTLGRQRVIVVGLPYLTGLWPDGTRDPAPWGYATMADARAAMDASTQQAAAAYGWAYVSLDGMTAATVLPDNVHPTTSGLTTIAARIAAASGAP